VGIVIFNKTTAQESAQAQRFREAALPHLDAVYTLARYLLRNSADAEDAAQECYLRALRHFDTFRGEHIKPWLFAILRNICHAEFGRRARVSLYDVKAEADDREAAVPLWQQEQESPETELARQSDTQTIQTLVAALPETFREVIVLREIEDLSYREIADIIDAPIGTVMSRLARARAMLREAWLRAESQPGRQDNKQKRTQSPGENQNQQPPKPLARTYQEQFT
jgi:RNA polymerase sigma-70 factor, ECF subfamily